MRSNKDKWGYPSSDPCAVCGKHNNNQQEPWFLYTVCEDHQYVRPVDIGKGGTDANEE